MACPAGTATCTAVKHNTCLTGYYLSTTTGLCVACGTGAATCTSTGSLTAKPGYFGTTTIAACSSTTDVLTCSSNANTAHLTCASGFFKSTAGTCTAC